MTKKRYRPALELLRRGEVLFANDGKWLHPLFELEAFLAAHQLRAEELEVWDRVVGRAAALFHVHLRLGGVEAGTLSEGGRKVLVDHAVPVRWERLVERIGCRTEELLADESDPARAYQLVRRRAGLGATGDCGDSPRESKDSPPCGEKRLTDAGGSP